MSILNFSNQQLSNLPKLSSNQILQCTELELSHNKFEKLPENISSFVNLTYLLAEHNKITTISEDIGYLKKLTILLLDNNNLTSIPTLIGKLFSIEYLSLNNNRLNKLPSQIGYLQNLKTLYIANNKIGNLSIGIGNLPKLEYFNISGNEISNLPQLSNYKALTELNASNNRLTQIPVGIGVLSKLEELYLHENQIDELPQEIVNLINLKSLNLSDNNLEKLPENIDRLIKLKILNLSHNKFNKLPNEIKNLTNLKEINLAGNNLPLPDDIPNTEPQKIIDYVLKHQHKKTSHQFNTQKVHVFQNLSLPKLLDEYTSTLKNAFEKWSIDFINVQELKNISKTISVVFLIITWDTHKNKKLVKEIIEKCERQKIEYYILFQPGKYVTLDSANKEELSSVLETHKFIENKYFDKVVEYSDLEHLTIAIKELVQRVSPAVKITKLQLENIGHFENIEVSLSDKVNCFVGENGTGKTTLLRAIALGLIGVKHKKISQRNLKNFLKIDGFDDQKNTIISEKSKITLHYSIEGEEFKNDVDFNYDKSTGVYSFTNDKMSEVIVNDNNLKVLMLGFPQNRIVLT